MQLSLQNFSALVEGMAASVQGAAQTVIDLTVGSVLRAILEANASVALWLQWLIVQVLSATRLATSSGADVDSFGADFGFVRLPAVAAVGNVTFSRFSPSVSAFLPVGTLVATAANTQSFLVAADSTNAAFNAGLGGYVLAAGIGSLTVAAAATLPGSAGNVQAGSISLLSAAVAGIDTVTNGSAFTGGQDAETDAAFKVRFGSYLGSLSKATTLAIGSAISGIQQGLSYTIIENINQTGLPQMGNFVVTIDDGSGHPPAALLSAVWGVVDAVRPIGTSFSVQAPVVSAANVAVTLTTAAGADHGAAVTAVSAAIGNYIAALPMGGVLSYTRLAQLAYDASSSVTNLSGLLLNGGTADLAPGQFGVVRAGTLAVG